MSRGSIAWPHCWQKLTLISTAYRRPPSRPAGPLWVDSGA
jgi:hypothetical protein